MTQHLTGIQRASWPMGARIALLLSAVLWALILSLVAALAQQAPPNPPVIATPLPDPANDTRTAQAASMLRQAQAALAAAQAAAQQAAMSAQPATPRVAGFTFSPELNDKINQLILTLIGLAGVAATAWVTSYLNTTKHNAFMQQVGASDRIDSSSRGLGAIVEQTAAKQGKSLSALDVSDPIVVAAAQKLIASYPEWAPLVGLTQDIAERKVLAGAIQQSVVPIVPTPIVTVVQPAPPMAVVEAAATPQPPPAQGSIT